LLLVAYDIPDDARRRRVMKALERLGRRVQYSVFVVEGSAVVAVAAALRGEIQPQEDNVRIQLVCARCAAQAALLGLAQEEVRRPGYSVI
jgi:CRISPR-associated endonuclease Cas2